MKKILSRDISWRELLLYILPALAVIALAFWITTRFIRPAPPDTLTISTGSVDGAYHRFAMRYKEILARDGITLELKPSSGSVENLARLKDDEANVDVAFLQSGLGVLSLNPLKQPDDETQLFSLANLYFEPLWVFTPSKITLTSFAELVGKRISIGQNGSGTQKVALELLNAHGVNENTAKFLNLSGSDAATAMAAGEIDALFVIAAPESPLVQKLLNTKELRVKPVTNAQALSRRFPYLSPVILSRGVFDFQANIPPQDVPMVATRANLVVREDLHPALVYLLLEAIVEVHATPAYLHQPGDFPHPRATDWPLAEEAQRYFKSGRPFLQRYLPFWLANLAERMLVLLVPILAVLIPLIRYLPNLFSWQQQRKVYRWYGELKFIERDISGGDLTPEARLTLQTRLNEIEHDAAELAVPLAFSDRVYTLRQHIDYVRARLAG